MTFKVPPNIIPTIKKTGFNNLDGKIISYLVKAKQLQIYTKQKFSFEAMKGILEKKIDSVLDTLPKSVELKLPKLNKVDDNKIKLPKLKKA